MATKNTEFTILRKDLLATQQDLEKLLQEYKEKGLDVEAEIKKLIDLGYIK